MEEESPHRARAVSRERNAQLSSDLLQTLDQRGGPLLDPPVQLRS